MKTPRFEVQQVDNKHAPVAWFEDIFWAYRFVEAVCTDPLNPKFEYIIVDNARTK